MLKSLRNFALAVLFLMPLLVQAQITCATGNPEVRVNGSGTGQTQYFPGYAYYKYSYSEVIVPADSLEGLGEIAGLEFFPQEGNTNGTYYDNCEIYLAHTDRENLSTGFIQDLTTFELVYEGSLNYTAGEWKTIAFDTPFAYDGVSNVVVAIRRNHGSYGSNNKYFLGYTATQSVGRYVYQDSDPYTIGSITGGTATATVAIYHMIGCPAGIVTCPRVTSLQAVDVTDSSATLTWVDTSAASVSYTILSGTTVVAENITTTSYNLSGLEANTLYNYSVRVNCADNDTSRYANVSFRTACGSVSLPYFTSFEPTDLDPTTTTALPFCWVRHNNGTSGVNLPYAYNAVSNANTGSYSLYFYFTNSTSYGDTVMAVMPRVDVSNFPMSGNQIRFMARVTSGTFPVMIGTMTDPADATTFVVDSVVLINGGYKEYEVFIGENGNGAYPAIMVSQLSTSSASLYIDDLFIEVRPTCIKPSVFTAEAAGSTSLRLAWTDDVNSGATYYIRSVHGTDTAWYTTTDTVYVINGLQPSANYYLQVTAHCSATDSSRSNVLSSSVRTLYDGHEFGSFTVTGTEKRGDLTFDTANRNITIPIWYTDNVGALLSSQFNITFSVPSYASTWIDTVGDGSFSCRVYTSDLKNYLHVNVPMVVRIYAEDTNFYSDYTITLVGESCVKNRNYSIEVFRTSYVLTWDNPDTLVSTNYFINSTTRLSESDLATAQHLTLSGVHSYTAQNLERGTKYYIYLKSECESEWYEDSVRTLTLTGCDEYDFANGTYTNSNIPLYGNYAERAQRIQSIYPASMLEDLVGYPIDSLHYFVSSGQSTTSTWGGTIWEISLGTTTQANLQSGYVDTNLLTRVYTGYLTASVADGMSISFDEPFLYTGGNLVVQFVQRVPQGYTDCNFYGTNNGVASASRYSYPASAANLFTDNGTAQSFLPRIAFNSCFELDPCPEVTDLRAEEITHESAVVRWTASDADYRVGHHIIVSTEILDAQALESATPTVLGGALVSYNVNGLLPDQDYYIYLKALCNGTNNPEGVSGWATSMFHTYPTCRVPEIESVTVMGKHTAEVSVRNTGLEAGQANNFSYLVSTSLLNDAALNAATPTATGIETENVQIENLNSDTKYYIYFRNENTAMACVSPWSTPDSVMMPKQMPAPVGMTAYDIAHNGLSAFWISDLANFADETAWRTAIAEHGQIPTTWTTVTDTLTAAYVGYHMYNGLTLKTAYDIYVCAYDETTGMTSDTVKLDSIRTISFPSVCEVQGTGTSTQNYFFPGYYGWQYMANLYDIDQTGAISAIAAELTTGNNNTAATMEVWVKEVPATFEFTTATTFESMIENATKILDVTDEISLTTADQGWIEFPFAEALNVTMGNQLLVMTRGVGCTTNGGCTRNERYSTVANKSWNKRQDSTDPGLTTTGTVSNNRTNLQICYVIENTCLDINTVYAMDITDTSANIVWRPGNEENAWQYVVSTVDTLSETELETAAVAINTSNVALSNLMHDTTYFFYVRPVCDVNLNGVWSRMNFATAHADYYDVVVNVNDATRGSVSGDGSYREGAEVVLTATATEGNAIYAWRVGEEVVYTEELTLTVDSNIEVTAYFYPVEASIAATEVTYWVGTGMNQAVIAINWADTALAWGVNFGGDNMTVGAALDSIQAVDPRFSYTIAGGYLTDINFTEDGVTFSGASYWESKHNGVSDWGMSQPLANGDFEKWAEPDAGIVVDSIYYENWGWSYIYLYPNTITAVTAPQMWTVTVNFDAAMGTVSGMPEGQVLNGTEITLTATPNANYSFSGWSNGESDATISITVTSDTTLTATFVPNVGIENSDEEMVNIFSANGRIVVSGAEGREVYVYDVNGRQIESVKNAGERIEIEMLNSGAYMVKVGGMPARRVVVIR